MFTLFHFKMDTSVVDNEDKISEAEEILENENIVQSDVLHPLSPDCEKIPSFISQNGEIPNGVTSVIRKDYGKSLTIQDVQRIQVTFNEFISKALLPYMERQCRNLNELASFGYIRLKFCTTEITE